MRAHRNQRVFPSEDASARAAEAPLTAEQMAFAHTVAISLAQLWPPELPSGPSATRSSQLERPPSSPKQVDRNSQGS